MRKRTPFFRIAIAVAALAAMAFAPALRAADTKSAPAPKTEKKLPRLVDLGKGTCIPCKKMMPVMDELKEEYAGVLDVEYIDIGKNPDAAEKFAIRLIPTQVFLAPDGKELYRHEGFYSKKAILKRWKKLGHELTPAKPNKEKE